MGQMRALRAFTVVVVALGLTAAACGSGGTSESPAQSKTKITTNWEKFFDPAVPLDQKKNIVENYNGLLPILQAQQSNPQAQNIKAKVTDVTLSGDKQATVKYDIVNAKDNTPLLPGASGTAVKVKDNWQVSQQTFCQLIKLADQNAKCP
jgi:ABC-type glycerol-3-phosphate transport system substrate-binding protein